MLRATPFVRWISGVARERGLLFPPCPLVHLSFPYPAMLRALEFFLTINFRRRTGDGKVNPALQGLIEAREIVKQRELIFLKTLLSLVQTPLPRERKEPGDREDQGRFQAAPLFWPALGGDGLTGKDSATVLHLPGRTEDGKESLAPHVPIRAREVVTPQALVLLGTLLSEGQRPQPREPANLLDRAHPARLLDVPRFRSESGGEESSGKGPVLPRPEGEMAYSLIYPRGMTAGKQLQPVMMAPRKWDRIKIAPLTISPGQSIGAVPSTTDAVPSLSYRTRAETGRPLRGLDLPQGAESIPAAGYQAGNFFPPSPLEHLIPAGALAAGPPQGKRLSGDLNLDHPEDFLESARKSPPEQINLGNLADEVYRRIEKKIRIERERRGVFR